LTKRESKKKCQNWSSWHDYLNVESVIIMIRSIDSNQQTKRNNAHLMLTTAMGGAIGAGARYIVPTQNEVKSLRTAADTFFSNASVAARGANRSILKYSAVGAVVAGVLCLASKIFGNKNAQTQKYDDSFEYSRMAALIEAPDIAGEFFLYDC